MSINYTQKEPLNYIHPLAPRVVSFGVDTFLVNFKMADEGASPTVMAYLIRLSNN